METLYLDIIDSNEKIPFVLTYGIHKELQEYLMNGEKLFKLYNETAVAEQVIIICLSKRNAQGQITAEFNELQLVSAQDMLSLIDLVFEYFSDFFLKNQKKMVKLTTNLNQISQQSTQS